MKIPDHDEAFFLRRNLLRIMNNVYEKRERKRQAEDYYLEVSETHPYNADRIKSFICRR